MRMNCFDRRTLMVLSLTLSSGFSKSSAIVRPAEPALSWITLRLESFASYIHLRLFLILLSRNRQIPGLATGAVGHSLFYSRR
mgnify:CR=1 FL=1